MDTREIRRDLSFVASQAAVELDNGINDGPDAKRLVEMLQDLLTDHCNNSGSPLARTTLAKLWAVNNRVYHGQMESWVSTVIIRLENLKDYPHSIEFVKHECLAISSLARIARLHHWED